LAFLAISARWLSIDLVNSSGPPGANSCAVAFSRSLMMASLSITSLMSAAIFWRSATGMVGGPNRPTSPSMVSAGWPASATVGMSG
jgi:hypothetical protein